MKIIGINCSPCKGRAHFGAALWSGGPDGIESDEIGLETARNLGRRLAQVAAKTGI